ncbi:MAG TPA: hypothetical protein GX710_07605 [Clostridiales bacterium]|nr:hypothetical protein [Clostridiales bacterium]
MKLKITNYISAVFFFLSSTSLMFIPFLNFEEKFPRLAYFLAGSFWIGLLIGVVLQIVLWFKTRKSEICKTYKKPKVIVTITFILSIISLIVVLNLFKNNLYALPISLFVLLLSSEAFCIIKRMERLK